MCAYNGYITSRPYVRQKDVVCIVWCIVTFSHSISVRLSRCPCTASVSTVRICKFTFMALLWTHRHTHRGFYTVPPEWITNNVVQCIRLCVYKKQSTNIQLYFSNNFLFFSWPSFHFALAWLHSFHFVFFILRPNFNFRYDNRWTS